MVLSFDPLDEKHRYTEPEVAVHASPNASRPTNCPYLVETQDKEDVAGEPHARFVVQIAQTAKQDGHGLGTDRALQALAQNQLPGLPLAAVVTVTTIRAVTGFQMGVDALVHGIDDGPDFVLVGQAHRERFAVHRRADCFVGDGAAAGVNVAHDEIDSRGRAEAEWKEPSRLRRDGFLADQLRNRLEWLSLVLIGCSSRSRRSPMDSSFQDLLKRLDHLSGQFQELRDGVQKAIRIADEDPEMALTRARKVLELVVREVYERRIKEPPGTRPLENLIQRLVKEGFFPDRLDAYATTVRKFGNVGTHTFGEKVTAQDVYQSLTQLMPILEWYFEVERPEAGQKPEQRQPTDATPSRSDLSPAASHMAVVPKGLRSFDAQDADFFLDLLPGPRDKNGLPESLRFWKHRIEATDELTFTVGVIYGPSGCGKSSLVKAGLLPRLAAQILPVYVESTVADTEARLLKGLRKHCTGLPGNMDLPKTIAALRQGQGLSKGQKVLIVLDQFEQWLHAKKTEVTTELVEALRQCDGERVQCIVMVRDDFWLAVSRFMGDLHIELVQGQNCALVDLFDLIHARSVLAAFGRAFGRLEQNATKEQERFLGHAVRGLAQDGRVICVRLALFTEMVKSKPWTSATLKEVGGTEGVGVTFLEETFSASSAPPDYRYHQKAARAVLKALLPDSGSDIRGHMRSYAELLAASGYADRPKDFGDLIGILDGRIRLITPTDPEGKAEAEDSVSQVQSGERYYQLTHDYLVPSLREWLTRKQRETRKGRAELRLAARSELWNLKPEDRHLPSLWEYLNIRLLTSRKDWTGQQRRMMGKAGRVHGIRSAIVAAVIVVMCLTGIGIRNAVVEKQNATRAEEIVHSVARADITQMPAIVNDLAKYRTWADLLLKAKLPQAKEGSSERLNMALALLPVDATQVEYVYQRLLDATPNEFPVLRDALAQYHGKLVEELWGVAEKPAQGHQQQRLRAAGTLAAYAPDDQRWAKVQSPVADDLVNVPAVYLAAWMDALRPVRAKLLAPLSGIFQDSKRTDIERSLSTGVLTDYATDRPEVLAELVMNADEKQFVVIYPKLQQRGEEGVPLLLSAIKKPLPDTNEDAKEALAKRQANAAVALVKMNHAAEVWPLLKHSPDPRVRTWIIHRLGPMGADAKVIVKRFWEETDVSIRRALLLSLGEFGPQALAMAERDLLIEKLRELYRTDPDPGLHAAAEWLLRQWQQDDWLKQMEEQWADDTRRREKRLDEIKRALAKDKPQPQWFVNSQWQTMVVIPGPVELSMGSSEDEAGRFGDEVLHRQRIGRSFMIAAKSVTVEQYLNFDMGYMTKEIRQFAPADDCPIVGTSWYQAAAYCNWLSKQEGLPESQWCYETNKDGEYAEGMKPASDFLNRIGYRLPTEAEWECACRASAVTSRYYGQTEELLSKYGWYLTNSHERSWPVGSLKPNDLGLFDMHGNVWTWCQDSYRRYETRGNSEATEDRGDASVLKDEIGRVLRGAGFLDLSRNLLSAHRFRSPPDSRNNNGGFRPARTLQ